MIYILKSVICGICGKDVKVIFRDDTITVYPCEECFPQPRFQKKLVKLDGE